MLYDSFSAMRWIIDSAHDLAIPLPDQATIPIERESYALGTCFVKSQRLGWGEMEMDWAGMRWNGSEWGAMDQTGQGVS